MIGVDEMAENRRCIPLDEIGNRRLVKGTVIMVHKVLRFAISMTKSINNTSQKRLKIFHSVSGNSSIQ